MPLLWFANNERNDTRNGVQLYKCQACSHQFRAGEKLSDERLWQLYQEQKQTYSDVINKRSTSKRSGKEHYTHRRLCTAMHSIDFYLPYLFTYQEDCCKGMPNTNNKIEGTFTDLKKNLNTHSGISKQNRKRFINGVFLALESKSANQNSSEPEPTAATL